MNIVILEGRMTKDPEIRQTTTGKAVVSFTLAVQKTKDKTDFIPCEAWDRNAEFAVQYFRKGDPAIVIGSWSTRQYEKDGQKRTAHTMSVNRFEFPLSKKTEKYDEPADSFAEADEEGELPY